jgi:exodeoxyribonuclease VII large subunit
MEERVWTVSEINSSVRVLIEQAFIPTWIRAEIGTLNIHHSGHVYLTLKDSKSQLNAVFFRGGNIARRMALRPGMEVEVFGKLTVYEVRGSYQLNISQIREVGVGNLQQRFDELKNKLFAEGLFEQSIKKKIPLLPTRIGVITSPTGAAIKDFLQVLNRRFPNINIKIYPSQVQGKGAEKYIVDGINFFNKYSNVDVIVLTRGGGSMEDLWAFNEEVLAREISKSQIPIISAIGHEIDFTISDFVADMRVPTPSAAAELVVTSRSELEQKLIQLNKALVSYTTHLMEVKTSKLSALSNSFAFKEPERIIREKQQRIDELDITLNRLITHNVEIKKQNLVTPADKLLSIFTRVLERKRVELERIYSLFSSTFYNNKNELNNKLNTKTAKLLALDPNSILNRGYAILKNKKSKEIISSVKTPLESRIIVELKDGNIELENNS